MCEMSSTYNASLTSVCTPGLCEPPSVGSFSVALSPNRLEGKVSGRPKKTIQRMCALGVLWEAVNRELNGSKKFNVQYWTILAPI